MKKLLLLIPLLVSLWTSPARATEIFRDTFTDTANVDLEAHTPDTGTSWSEITATANGQLEITAGGTAVDSVAVDGAGFSLYTANGSYPTANYDVEITFSFQGDSGTIRAWVFGCRYTTDNYYAGVVVSPSTTNDARFYSVASGTSSLLGQTDTAPDGNDVFVVSCIGNQVGLKKNGSFILGPFTDSTHTGAGVAFLGTGDFADLTNIASVGADSAVTLFTVNTVPPTASRRRTF